MVEKLIEKLNKIDPRQRTSIQDALTELQKIGKENEGSHEGWIKSFMENLKAKIQSIDFIKKINLNPDIH